MSCIAEFLKDGVTNRCPCKSYVADAEAVFICCECGHEDNEHDDFDMPFSGSMEHKS